MDSFTIDTQTFNDLDILNSKDGVYSVFNLFKQTKTAAARKRLMEIMQHPSSNLQDICLRSATIKFFYEHKIVFDVKDEHIDLIDYYLKSKFKKFRSNPIDTMADYVSRKSSNDYYVIKIGIRYLILLTRYINSFINALEGHQLPAYLVEIFQQLQTIIEEGVLVKAAKLDELNLSFLEVGRLDRALRGPEKEKMFSLLSLIYELDVIGTAAAVASARGFSMPVFSSEGMQLRINGLFHPGIGNAVKNDVCIDEKQNLLFLTGSNMAGKSSLLKSLGLVIYLAHIGFPVPATAVTLSVFKGLITTINLPDNLNQGLSHYYTEVKRVREVAEHLLKRDRMFVIFNELFRGTNVKDAFDGSALIISELSTIADSAFIISTHIIELAEVLKKHHNINFRYLDTGFHNQKPVFTYQLLDGISKEALGMYIVRNEGIVEILQQAASSRQLTSNPND